MLKKIIIILSCISLTAFINVGGRTKTYLEANFFKGKVRTVIESNTYVINGVKSQEPLTKFYEFDEKGNLISEEKKDVKSGITDQKKVYTYDERNNEISKIEYSGNEKIETKEERKYDENNNIIEFDVATYFFKESKSNVKYTYKLDINGNPKEMTQTNIDGGVVEISNETFIYNEKGCLLERKQFDKTNKLVSTYKYKYDLQGRETEFKSVTVSGVEIFRIITKYDEKSNYSESIFYSKGVLNSNEIFQYPSFDDNGNWTARKTFRIGLESTTERKFEYY